MTNFSLTQDYILRAGNRLEVIDLLFKKKSYADVVLKSQETVELSLKALLRFSNVAPPPIHDVSNILKEQAELLPSLARRHLKKLAQISRQLRRDRELAFYGTEDLTPSEFYHRQDAKKALEDAQWVHGICSRVIEKKQ